MKLLLDTHALLWWSFEPGELPEHLLERIKSPEVEVYVSAASIWELATKLTKAKMRLPMALDGFIEYLSARTRTQILPITAAHAVATLGLPLHHRDPFDRMLVAQCLVEGMHLATRDATLKQYPVRVVW